MMKYPELRIDLNKLKSNIKEINKLCKESNINLTAVIKGCNSPLEIAKVYDELEVLNIASSRMDQLISLKKEVKCPLMLIRIPMLSEVEQVIKYTDISLNSEVEVLKKLNQEANKQNKIHGVILMKDLGDLREGFFEESEIIDAAIMVEDLENLKLLGIGTNVGCYGSIVPTVDKLNELVETAEKIEQKIGRKLEYISGGATSSLIRLMNKDMPRRINHLRIGEGILNAKDLKDLWGYNMDFLYQDVFTLRCEVIEIKEKPTHPIGEIFVDAFGNKPVYEDKGIRKRALLAIGKADYGYLDNIYPKEKDIKVIGASSDHTIIDVEDKKNIKLGDIIEFDISYPSMLFLTSSNSVNKTYTKQKM